MKITDIQTWAVTANWRTLIFLKVLTDEGVVGVGESTIERSTSEVRTRIEGFKGVLVGRNPLEINDLWQTMMMYPIWPAGSATLAAISGIEIALWDIMGQALGVPVYQLLGGKLRTRVPAYANGWFHKCATVGDYAEAAAKTVERDGYQAVKWDPFGAVDITLNAVEERKAIECVRQVREAVGPDVALMIEFHFKFDLHTAMRLCKRLEEFAPYWYEDPLRIGWYNPDCWHTLRQVTHVPFMEGGSWTRWGYRRIMEEQLVQHIMPDILHCGGLAEAARIASLAEMYGVTCSPHNVGGAPGRAATLHFAAAVPNFLMLEHLPLLDEHPAVTEVTSKPLPDVDDGYLPIPEGPGLGVNLDHVEEVAAKYPYDPSKEAPKLALGGLNTVEWHPLSPAEQKFMRENPQSQWRLDYS